MPRKSAVTKKSEGGEKNSRTVVLAAALLLCVAVSSGAIMWGRSDAGQIDVSATIQNSQNTAVRDENTPPQSPVISNELSEMQNGGLEPQTGDSVLAPTPAPVPDSVATGTASTTEGSASGSDEDAGAQEMESAKDETVI